MIGVLTSCKVELQCDGQCPWVADRTPALERNLPPVATPTKVECYSNRISEPAGAVVIRLVLGGLPLCEAPL